MKTLYEELWELPWRARQHRIRWARTDRLEGALHAARVSAMQSGGFIRLDREIARELERRER